jgi:hypothetical protein
MCIYDFPVAPVLAGMVLGSLSEQLILVLPAVIRRFRRPRPA